MLIEYLKCQILNWSRTVDFSRQRKVSWVAAAQLGWRKCSDVHFESPSKVDNRQPSWMCWRLLTMAEILWVWGEPSLRAVRSLYGRVCLAVAFCQAMPAVNGAHLAGCPHHPANLALFTSITAIVILCAALLKRIDAYFAVRKAPYGAYGFGRVRDVFAECFFAYFKLRVLMWGDKGRTWVSPTSSRASSRIRQHFFLLKIIQIRLFPIYNNNNLEMEMKKNENSFLFKY